MDKGTLRTVEGDATDLQTTSPKEVVVIVHLCNNKNKWGKGFVLALSKKWKEPEQRYRDFCRDNSKVPILGSTCFAKVDTFLVVANMIGQDGTVSPENPKPIKYKALANCMADVRAYIEMIQSQTSNPVVIHCPKFGSGLSGGCWDFVLELIREIWLEAGIDVVVYEYVPK